jgi:hypothetical protein
VLPIQFSYPAPSSKGCYSPFQLCCAYSYLCAFSQAILQNSLLSPLYLINSVIFPLNTVDYFSLYDPMTLCSYICGRIFFIVLNYLSLLYYEYVKGFLCILSDDNRPVITTILFLRLVGLDGWETLY